MNAPAPLPETQAAAPVRKRRSRWWVVRKRRSRWWVVRGTLAPRTAGLLTAFGLIAPFFIWWLYTALGLNDPLFMPGPSAPGTGGWKTAYGATSPSVFTGSWRAFLFRR